MGNVSDGSKVCRFQSMTDIGYRQISVEMTQERYNHLLKYAEELLCSPERLLSSIASKGIDSLREGGKRNSLESCFVDRKPQEQRTDASNNKPVISIQKIARFFTPRPFCAKSGE